MNIIVIVFSIFILFVIPINFIFIQAHIPDDYPGVVVKNVDEYKVKLLPYPKEPLPNDNSTKLNFNIQKDGLDVIGLFASIIIKDKKTDSILDQIPYKFYPVGDFLIDYIFSNSSDYEILLQTKINSDPKYETVPLITNFDITVKDSGDFLGSVFDFLNPFIILLFR